jgi:drug/metabolite transporter (DMT)-like permease
MMAVGYGLWTRAMTHPAGARFAPAAYATPLLSSGVLLATGERISALGLLGCALIVVCAAGVILDAYTPLGYTSRRHERDDARPPPAPRAPHLRPRA